MFSRGDSDTAPGLCPPHCPGRVGFLCRPPAPAQCAPQGWGHHGDFWRCSWASWSVTSPPPRALPDQAGAGSGQPLGTPSPAPNCLEPTRARHGGGVSEGWGWGVAVPEGVPTWTPMPRAHSVAGLGTPRHSPAPLLIDFLGPLCTCKNRTRLASVPGIGGN